MGGCICGGAARIGGQVCLSYQLGVGFGMACVTKDGKPVWEERPNTKRYPRLRRFELMAREDPDHDWRYEHFAPLTNFTVQRQGKNKWIIIDSGIGFA